MDQVCRSCMGKVSERAKKSTTLKTIEMFSFCMNMQIAEEDKLPKQFCNKCIEKIEISYSFISEAQKVDLTLRNILFRVETSVIVKTERDKTNVENNTLNPVIDSVGNISEDTFPKDKVDITPVTENSNSNALKCDEESYAETGKDFQHYNDDNTFYSESDDEENDQKFIVTSGEDKAVVDKRMAKKKNACTICLKRFASKIWFTKHMANEHSQKTFSCKHCPKTFKTHSTWKQHLTVHSMERNFSCAQCGRRYKRRKQLAVHMRSHGDFKAFVCDLCSKSFKKKSLLMGHMMLHQNDRKHLCSHCGMDFVSKSTLVTHTRIHTGERPYRCGECPKAFSTSSSLRRHERIHRGEAPHVCATCLKAFNSLGSMHRHQRRHTGEQPYKCPWCARAFVDSWKRKVHLMRVHGAGLAEIPRLAQSGEIAEYGRPRKLQMSTSPPPTAWPRPNTPEPS